MMIGVIENPSNADGVIVLTQWPSSHEEGYCSRVRLRAFFVTFTLPSEFRVFSRNRAWLQFRHELHLTFMTC